jgi:hypothetical protein
MMRRDSKILPQFALSIAGQAEMTFGRGKVSGDKREEVASPIREVTANILINLRIGSSVLMPVEPPNTDKTMALLG